MRDSNDARKADGRVTLAAVAAAAILVAAWFSRAARCDAADADDVDGVEVVVEAADDIFSLQLAVGAASIQGNDYDGSGGNIRLCKLNVP